MSVRAAGVPMTGMRAAGVRATGLPRAADRGTVTAEFAIVLPAALLVVAGCLGGVQVIARQSATVGTAAAVARSLARGDDPGHTRRLAARLGPEATYTAERDGDLVCALVAATARLGPAGPAVPVEARSCALAG